MYPVIPTLNLVSKTSHINCCPKILNDLFNTILMSLSWRLYLVVKLIKNVISSLAQLKRYISAPIALYDMIV